MADEKQGSQIQVFEVRSVKRSEIKAHPKNPRIITPTAKRRLRETIKKHGLMEPPIVNVRTSHILGGHQRTSIMDEMKRYNGDTGRRDYELMVAFVDVPVEDEEKILVLLNNQSLMGDWELNKLADIVLDPVNGIEPLGFDKTEIQLLFEGDRRFEPLLRDTDVVTNIKASAEQIDKMKESKKAAREKMRLTDNDIDVYIIVCCRGSAEKEAMLSKLGMPIYETYIPSDPLLEVLGVEAVTNAEAAKKLKEGEVDASAMQAEASKPRELN